MLMLENENGIVKKAPIGFSWTIVFFGFFVPMLRGDWIMALVLAALIAIAGAATYGIGSYVVLGIFAVKYNEWYLDGLKEKGFKVVN